VFCTNRAVNNTCYFYNSTFLGRDRAQQTCEGMGGWLVAYNTGDEQLQVENYFTGKYVVHLTCVGGSPLLALACVCSPNLEATVLIRD
jgi:hypothetical protein